MSASDKDTLVYTQRQNHANMTEFQYKNQKKKKGIVKSKGKKSREKIQLWFWSSISNGELQMTVTICFLLWFISKVIRTLFYNNKTEHWIIMVFGNFLQWISYCWEPKNWHCCLSILRSDDIPITASQYTSARQIRSKIIKYFIIVIDDIIYSDYNRIQGHFII